MDHIKTGMNAKLYQTLVFHKVPWAIIKHMVDEELVELEPTVERWSDSDAVGDHAPRALGIENWPVKRIERICARLAFSMRELHKTNSQGHT